MQIYATLYKGLEYPRILVSARILEPIPHGYGEVTILCAKHCSRHLRNSSEQSRQKSLPLWSLFSSGGGVGGVGKRQ